MNRRLLLLNLILAALLAWSGNQLRLRWQEARRHQAEVLGKAPVPLPVTPPPSLPPVAPAPATEYLDVAQQTLFSEDRNPNVEIQVEPPKPEPPVPPMPVYHGQMAVGTPVILLSTGASPQKAYLAGDDIGEFKVLAFDRERITLGWNGKELSRELRTLAAKDDPPARNTANVNAAPAKPANGVKGAPAAPKALAPAASVARIGDAGPGASAAAKNNPIFGAPLGVNRACVPSDTTPAGTVRDGFKKVIVQSLMGECYWEPVKQ